MKNELKILIAVIVVILIILIGAYALSVSKGPQATVTPTAQSTNTPTPTPTPLASGTGGSSGGASSPTPTATMAPTSTPTPTIVPSPTPASGIEMTQFGYVITYPPLKAEVWSTNPPPQYSPGVANNTVYFNPTSSSLNIDYLTDDQPDYLVNATIYRNGDLSGTTTVNIHVATNGNIDVTDATEGSQMSYYYLKYNGQYIGGDFQVTFGPGVSSQTITIDDQGLVDSGMFGTSRSLDSTGSSYLGDITLTITGVDDGYTYGDNDQYTLTINSPTPSSTPTPGGQDVQFILAGGYVGNRSYFDGSTMDRSSEPTYDNNNIPWWEANITLTRASTTGSLSPTVEISGTHDIPNGNIYISQQPTFADGQATATVQVTYTLSHGTDEDHSYAYLSIDSSPSYTIGYNNPFYLDTFFEW
jgi:hypothetical protein